MLGLVVAAGVVRAATSGVCVVASAILVLLLGVVLIEMLRSTLLIPGVVGKSIERNKVRF